MFFATGPALFLLGACSANVAAQGADADAEMTHALLIVEQSAAASEDASRGAHASVWFLRVADEQALEAATRLVAGVWDLPPPGRCTTLGTGAADPTAPLAPVELAYAGDVTLETDTAKLRLAIRAFPDVADLVSGVVYTVREQSPVDVVAGSMFRLRATGAPDFESASAQAPGPPKDVRVEGQPIGTPGLEIRRDAPLSLDWSAPASSSDTVFVDIVPVPASPQERVRCTLEDRGSGQIPAVALPTSPAMDIEVHRVRDVALRSETGEAGTAHFDFGLSARVKIAQP